MFWNHGAESTYGWTRREALGRVVHELLHTEFPGEKSDALTSLRRDGRWEGLLRQRTRDRSEVVVWSRWAAVRDGDGRITSVLESNRDVTSEQRLVQDLRAQAAELQAANAELRGHASGLESASERLKARTAELEGEARRVQVAESEARDHASRLAAIIDSAMDAIITVDDDQRVALFNRAAERLLGVAAADAIGQPIDRFIPMRSVPEDARHIRALVRAGDTSGAGSGAGIGAGSRGMGRMAQITARRPDGSEFPIEAAISQTRVAERELFTVIVRDATEHVLLEEQFRQAQKMEAIGRLAGGIAHDFNNLLSAITGYLEFVRPAVSDPVALADLAEVWSAAERAAQLTRQLLIFSRSQVARPRIVHPNDVIAGLEKLLGRIIGEDVRLVTELAPDVERVRIDPAQLEQALLNLAINSRDAMPQGGTLTIATRARRATDNGFDRRMVVIEVSDTGLGMDEETQARAFEPFFTTKEPGRGTGLGLPAVQSVAVQAGGTVTLESTLGAGTRVSLALPIADLAEPDDDQTRARVSSAAPGAGGLLLLVEDEDAVRALARRLLERSGHSVIEARTGEDALARWHEIHARGKAVDGVVTDVVMPDMGGRELVTQLRRLRPGLPIVYVSGYLADAVSGLDVSSPAQLIEKPFTGESLSRAVAAVLGRAAGDP